MDKILDTQKTSNILAAIRMYELTKNIQLLEKTLNKYNIEENLKSQIIKSARKNIGI
jgi:hypothetical protein